MYLPIVLILLLSGVIGWKSGSSCNCKPEKQPVCGKDGYTYDNECSINCANVVKRSDGECPCRIPKIYRPVCGVNGKTYINKGHARCGNMKIAHEGDCLKSENAIDI